MAKWLFSRFIIFNIQTEVNKQNIFYLLMIKTAFPRFRFLLSVNIPTTNLFSKQNGYYTPRSRTNYNPCPVIQFRASSLIVRIDL